MRQQLEKTPWDVLVIGGGATGVGTAIDAAARGYKTLLVEQSDFGKGTSSKSTKLIHGGVRYLQQGNISLVKEALHERALLKENAPHIVSDLAFVVPIYSWWAGPFYGVGLKLYDMLAGKEGFGQSVFLSKEETIKYLPTVEQKELQRGVLYHDGQFDDCRLLISMVRTAEEQGATLLNYMKFETFNYFDDKISGANIVDVFNGEQYKIKAKVVINATGVFSDTIRKAENINVSKLMQGSRGIHIVLDKEFLPGNTAIMIPHTDDGRVLFAVPWHDKLLLGTTDTPVHKYDLDPQPEEKEIDFLLQHAAQYLVKNPTRKDIKSVFSGLRPLVKKGGASNTSEISREHQIEISEKGLVSIMGGKWTTYRKMAKDVVNKASTYAALPRIKTKTKNLRLHGYLQGSEDKSHLKYYGTDAKFILKIQKEELGCAELVHPHYKYTVAEIVFSVRFEKAKTVEDVLARRVRLLFLDVEASLQVAQKVAEIMAKELNFDFDWVRNQVVDFENVAKTYRVSF